MRYELKGGKPSNVFQQEGPGNGGDSAPYKRPGATEDRGRGKKAKGAGKGSEQRRNDGRFYRGRNGVEICFLWSREEGACSEPCSHKRMHICEFCRQPHRTIHCPSHKGWNLKPKGGGAGK